MWLATFHEGWLQPDLMMHLLGAALIVVAALVLSKPRITARKFREQMGPAMRGRQPAATIVGGAIVAVLVTLTSVRAGALEAVLLVSAIKMATSRRHLSGMSASSRIANEQL